MSWGVWEIKGPPRVVHVAPCDKEGYIVADHRLALDCPCMPRLIRDTPIDDPILSHRAPDHHGSVDRFA
jgi:hypothetical protein